LDHRSQGSDPNEHRVRSSEIPVRPRAARRAIAGIRERTTPTIRCSAGFAMKATFCTVNGEDRPIYKQPRTDSKKNSHRGLIAVHRDAAGRLQARFPVTRAEEQSAANLLQPVFENGVLLQKQTLAGIRALVERELAADLARGS